MGKPHLLLYWQVLIIIFGNSNDPPTVFWFLFSQAAYVKAAHNVITNVARSVEPLYPPRVWVDLDPAFFATFWCLESGDLVFPSAAYQRQRDALRTQMDSIEANTEMVSSPHS